MMIFLGVTLNPGDVVSLVAKTVPLPEVQVAVITVSDGVLEVMSTLLAPFKHSGFFEEANVTSISVILPAEEVIPRESRGKQFKKGQHVSCDIKGEKHEGFVIAAFDGIVSAQRIDGEYLTGGANHFT
ncbi:hypothetical protein IT409_02210 [Candidatus Falkowbacteria bacterium]|nr:hypothetical protein [Candidatus Falkowbacteria bacterium]